MFDNLSDKLTSVFRKMRGQTRLNEKNTKEALRDVKLALLEADVNFKVVKAFIRDVAEKALGEDVKSAISPGQHFIKVVHQELAVLLGTAQEPVHLAAKSPTVLLFVGLQGSGKTTSVAKVASFYKRKGHKPLMVACDVYRPSAVDQLKILGEQLDIPVFDLGTKADPVKIAQKSLKRANELGADIVLLDSAGRLHIDDSMMDELRQIKKKVAVTETLLVADAMTGQEAVRIAEEFTNMVGLDGVILTKLDGDARGGAALSLKKVTGKSIKFVGTGEKLDQLEAFHPDRMASRILGMGDVLTLIEKAEEVINKEDAKRLEKKLLKQTFDLEDFRQQLVQIKKMGSLDQIMGMLPGMNQAMANQQIDNNQLARIEGLIHSMTPGERRNPDIINGSRRKRIAKGAGQEVQDLNKLLKQFNQMRKMLKKVSGMSKTFKKRKGIKSVRNMFPGM